MFNFIENIWKGQAAFVPSNGIQQKGMKKNNTAE